VGEWPAVRLPPTGGQWRWQPYGLGFWGFQAVEARGGIRLALEAISVADRAGLALHPVAAAGTSRSSGYGRAGLSWTATS